MEQNSARDAQEVTDAVRAARELLDFRDAMLEGEPLRVSQKAQNDEGYFITPHYPNYDNIFQGIESRDVEVHYTVLARTQRKRIEDGDTVDYTDHDGNEWRARIVRLFADGTADLSVSGYGEDGIGEVSRVPHAWTCGLPHTYFFSAA